MPRGLLVSCALFALCAQVERASEPAWRLVERPFATSFPRDHGAHPDFRTEWWYATGIVQGTAGADRFGWQWTVFRQGLEPGEPNPRDPLLSPRQIYAGHFAVVDLGTGKLVHAERVRRAVPGLASASVVDLDVALDGWTLQRADDDSLHAVAIDRDLDIAIDLVLQPSKPLVLHGQDGVSPKGPEAGNASAYVSWTRLETSGSITLSGRTHRVRGESWFDHEWGSGMLSAGVAGWDWFGLRLDDGRELMLYHLRRADGSATAESSGTLVERDGTRRHLLLSEFTLMSTSTWTSTRSHAVYPARWRVTVPAFAIDVTLESQVADCEIDGRTSTGTIYWEGPVRVAGNVTGSGYGELTGYAGSMAARF